MRPLKTRLQQVSVGVELALKGAKKLLRTFRLGDKSQLCLTDVNFKKPQVKSNRITFFPQLLGGPIPFQGGLEGSTYLLSVLLL